MAICHEQQYWTFFRVKNKPEPKSKFSEKNSWEFSTWEKWENLGKPSALSSAAFLVITRLPEEEKKWEKIKNLKIERKFDKNVPGGRFDALAHLGVESILQVAFPLLQLGEYQLIVDQINRNRWFQYTWYQPDSIGSIGSHSFSWQRSIVWQFGLKSLRRR